MRSQPEAESPSQRLSQEIRKAERQRLENMLLLHIRVAGLPEPDREFRFCPGRRYRFDFAWTEELIAAECEGGVWTAGRHVRGKGFSDDCEKYAMAAAIGWRVFRFTAEMIESGRALWFLETALKEDEDGGESG